MTDDNEELTYEELLKIKKMFEHLALGLALVNVGLLIGLIFSVFRGFPWYYAVLLYLVLTFILRVLKMMCRNIAEEADTQAEALSLPFGFAD